MAKFCWKPQNIRTLKLDVRSQKDQAATCKSFISLRDQKIVGSAWEKAVTLSYYEELWRSRDMREMMYVYY